MVIFRWLHSERLDQSAALFIGLPTILAVRTVPTSAAAVEAKLASRPELDRPLPAFLQLKFPTPTSAEVEGLAVGDRRTISYARQTATRQLVFVVAERSPGYVRFHAVSDDTKIGTWLTWRDAEVRWYETPGGATLVQWTLSFERLLSPGWYF